MLHEFLDNEIFSLAAEEWQISLLGSLKKQFAKDCQKLILLLSYLYHYCYPCVAYVGLASFEFQRHELLKFREIDICCCLIDVSEQLDNLMSRCKIYFTIDHKAYLCYFEQCIDVHLVAIGQVMSGNFEENFFFNK